VANRKRLADFLTTCHFYLESKVIMEREVNDDIILAKLQYTANRLLTRQSASMIDAAGQANWLTDLQVHRLIGTFTYAHLWKVLPTMPNHLILLASVGTIRRHDGWKGLDIANLLTNSNCHLMHHPEGKHFSVPSSPPTDKDISICRAHLAYHLKNTLFGYTVD
jgi:hypothetical protein